MNEEVCKRPIITVEELNELKELLNKQVIYLDTLDMIKIRDYTKKLINTIERKY